MFSLSGHTSDGLVTFSLPLAPEWILCQDDPMTTLSSFDEGMPCWVDIMVPNEEQHHDKRAFLTALFDWTWELGTPEMGSYATARSNGRAVMGLGIGEGTNGAATTYFSTNDIESAVAR